MSRLNALKRSLTPHMNQDLFKEDSQGSKHGSSTYFASSLKEMLQGFLWWIRWQRICLQGRRPRFDSWVGKIPWRGEWQPTPVFITGESHGQRSLVSYSPSGWKELDITEQLTLSHFRTLLQGSTWPCPLPPHPHLPHLFPSPLLPPLPSRSDRKPALCLPFSSHEA